MAAQSFADMPPEECPLCGGPLASDGVCADDNCDTPHPDCESYGCDIREGDAECRRCHAEPIVEDEN